MEQARKSALKALHAAKKRVRIQNTPALVEGRNQRTDSFESTKETKNEWNTAHQKSSEWRTNHICHNPIVNEEPP